MMNDKSEGFSYFRTFVNQIKTQDGAVIKVLRSDNAMGYKPSNSQQYFCKSVVIHEASCTHNRQQNGAFERKHRHLLEAAGCIMINMSVPKSYWPKALLTSCNLINRMPLLNLTIRSLNCASR